MKILMMAIIIFLFIKLEKQKRELENYKNENNKKINFCPKCGYQLVKNKTESASKASLVENKDIIKEPPKEKQKTYNDTEIKNSIILSAGAILIVIAAIVFLTTTWTTTIGSIKTLVIIFMFFVFLGAHYIAKNILNIRQTAQVFLYIAYSYLPLVLLSISLFQTLGYYLSFYGPGKYIYLCISSIIISLVYYNNIYQKSDKFFLIGSYVFQLISAVFFMLTFDNSLVTSLLGIGFYSLFYHILYNKDHYYVNKEYHLKINKLTTLGLLISVVYCSVFLNEIVIESIPNIILLITIYFNLFFYLTKEKSQNNLFKILSPVIIIYIFYIIANLIGLNFINKQLILLAGITTSCLADLLLYEKATIETYIVSGITMIILYFETLIENIKIPSYLLILLFILYSIVMLKNTNKNNTHQGTIPIIILLLIHIFLLDLFLTNSVSIIGLTLIYLVVLLLGYILKENSISKNIHIINPIFTMISFSIVLIQNIDKYKEFSILALILATTYFIVYLIMDKKELKYVAYSWIIIMIGLAVNYIWPEEEAIKCIASITAIITYGIESLLSKKEDKNYEFLFIEFILAFITLMGSKNIMTLLLYIPLVTLYICHNKNWQKSEYLNIIPIISLNTYLHHQAINSIAIIPQLITICLLIYLYFSKKKEYIILSLINIISMILLFNINKYISISTLIISAFFYNYVDNDKKDTYQASIYILITILLKMIIKDLQLNDITFISIGVIFIPLILISRTIIARNNQDYKVFEYIGMIIINIIALGYFRDETDGLLFVFLLLGLTIFSYIKKYGPIFLISLIFILINIFILTEVFWLSLPWWIYILLVGCILIAFAIKNEISEKNTKKSSLKELAEKMNL